MTNPKVVQTWASVMESHLYEAARLAGGPVLNDPLACASVARLLRQSAELLELVAKHHRQMATDAMYDAAHVQQLVTP